MIKCWDIYKIIRVVKIYFIELVKKKRISLQNFVRKLINLLGGC